MKTDTVTQIQNIPKKFKLAPEMLTIPLISGYQVLEGFTKAQPEERLKVLARDSIILGCTCAGALGAGALSGKAFSKSAQNMQNTFLKSLWAPVGGVAGGVIAGHFAEKYFPAPYPKIEEKIQDKLGEAENPETKKAKNSKDLLNNVMTIAMTCIGIVCGDMTINKFVQDPSKQKLPQLGLRALAAIGGGLAGLLLSMPFHVDKKNLFDLKNYNIDMIMGDNYAISNGVEVGRARGSENRIKKGFYEIIAGVVVPTAIMLPITHRISSKGVKSCLVFKPLQSAFDKWGYASKEKVLEMTIMMPLTIGGVYLGRAIGDYVNQKITDKIIKNEIWNNIQKAREQLIAQSFKSISAGNEFLNQQIISKLNILKKAEDNIKPENQ